MIVLNSKSIAASSCEVPPTEGDPFDPSKLDAISLVTADFGKRFNQEHLNALKTTSLAATTEFIQKAGVKLFATPGAQDNCRPMARLIPAADELMLKNWVEVVKREQSRQKDSKVSSALLGLYESNYQGSPHIFVREDISRLDLVHEYFHHLFRSRSGNEDSSDLSAQLKDSLEALNTSQASSQSSDSTIQHARRAQGLYWRLLVAGHLEEAVIGYELLSRVANAEITHVAKSSLGSHWYYTLAKLDEALAAWPILHTGFSAEVLAAVSDEYLNKQKDLNAFALKLYELKPQLITQMSYKDQYSPSSAFTHQTNAAASFSCGFDHD